MAFNFPKSFDFRASRKFLFTSLAAAGVLTGRAVPSILPLPREAWLWFIRRAAPSRQAHAGEPTKCRLILSQSYADPFYLYRDHFKLQNILLDCHCIFKSLKLVLYWLLLESYTMPIWRKTRMIHFRGWNVTLIKITLWDLKALTASLSLSKNIWCPTGDPVSCSV